MEDYRFQITLNGNFDGREQRACSNANLLQKIESICNRVRYEIVCDLDYRGKYKKQYGIAEADLQSTSSIGYLAFLFFSDPKKIGEVFKIAGNGQIISSSASDNAINLVVSGKEEDVSRFFTGLQQSDRFSQIVIQADPNDKATTAKFGKDYRIIIPEKSFSATAPPNNKITLRTMQAF